MQSKKVNQVVDKTEKAKNSNLKELEILYNHYCKLFSRYLDKNKDVENIEEKYNYIIRKRIELYFENNCTSSFFDYINYTLECADKCKIWDFDELKNRKYSTPVSDLIQQASTNLDARKKLIEKYMYIVERELRKWEIDIEYEDALQIGYLLLIKKTNQYFENYENNKEYYFSSYIIHSIHSSYPALIRLANEEKRNYSYHKDCIEYFDSFEDDIIEKIDISRAIEECNFSEREKGILNLKYGFNSEIINTIVEIEKRYNVTDKRIRQIDKKSLEKIKERLETACSSEYKQKSLKK